MERTKVYLDTDVILDVLLNRTEFVENSDPVLSLVDRYPIELCVTGVSFANLEYIGRKVMGKQSIKTALLDLSKLVTTISIDDAVVRKALQSDMSDFEDTLQIFAAKAHKITVVVTRNTKDYRKSGLEVLRPEQFTEKYYQSN